MLVWPLVALLFWLLSFLPLYFSSFKSQTKASSPEAPQNSSQTFLASYQDQPKQTDLPAPPSEKVLLHIEAEDFNQISGIKTEICNDFGGGWNISHVNDQDYSVYQIHVPHTGLYQFHFRVASATAGGMVEVFLNQASLLEFEVGNTKGWQEWKTLHHEARLVAGDHELSLHFSGEKGFLINMNWFEMELISNAVGEEPANQSNLIDLELLPQDNFWILHLKEQDGQFSSIEIKSLEGQIVFTQSLSKDIPNPTIFLPKDKLPKGIYWLSLKGETLEVSRKLLIL